MVLIIKRFYWDEKEEYLLRNFAVSNIKDIILSKFKIEILVFGSFETKLYLVSRY